MTPGQQLESGLSHHRAGRLAEAERIYRGVLAQQPNNPVALHLMGVLSGQLGRPDASVELIRRAIVIEPDFAEAQNSLGIALSDLRKFDEAIAPFRQAIRLKPELFEAYSNLGVALTEIRQFDEAIAVCRHAIRLKPDFAKAHANLGNALKEKTQLDEASAAYREAIRLGLTDAQRNLGTLLGDTGQMDAAIACFRQAMQSDHPDPGTHSNLIFALPFHSDYDVGMILEECRRWNDRFAEPLRRFIQIHSNDRDPDRKLRIGYVSPDFRDHCQSFFTIPLLSNHDSGSFEIFCYADVQRPDAITARIRELADQWRPIKGTTDEAAARKIREDKIDILVDLTMHMADGRPLIFARKPAPVQPAWLAYPGTTGMFAMDYRLTDPHLDPPGANDQFYSETSIRLPDSFWCYDPLTTEPGVGSLPAESVGRITFGCLNNFCKVNEQVVQLWAQVLKAVEGSRLMILCPEGSHRQPLFDLLQREGITSERIELVPRRQRLKYLEYYHRIDIGLDTLPYNGHTTSLDSFWMGVPIVTLVGKTVVGRAGFSQLTNLGLTDLIAGTREEYVQICVGLAKDLVRLAELRRSLRSRMQTSPLMDAPRFARNIEAAYRQMWRNWCRQSG